MLFQHLIKINQNYLQQPIPNPEDITDPTTTMNMALAIMAKSFKLNYSTPTNNNQRISSNPRNRQIAQLGNMTGYNDVIGNQVIQNAVQNPGVQNIGNQVGLIGVQGNGNQNQIGNGNLVIAHAEGNAGGQNGNQIRFYNSRGVAIDCSEGRGGNPTLSRRQASTSGTQTDSAPVYDSDGSAENDNDVISEDTSVEQGGETVEQHSANFEETRALYDSLYQNSDYTQLYDFLKYNQKEVDKLKAKRISKNQDPLALMENSNNPYVFPAPHQDQSSFNQNYLQQPMPNPEDITDLTTYAGQNAGNPAGYNDVIGNQNQIGNGNLVAARAEGNAAGQNENKIRCYNCRGVGHYARNCTVRPRRRDAA
nr:hypothetical protein [Tanacetum cinerariifolium]